MKRIKRKSIFMLAVRYDKIGYKTFEAEQNVCQWFSSTLFSVFASAVDGESTVYVEKAPWMFNMARDVKNRLYDDNMRFHSMNYPKNSFCFCNVR